jgi:hypothetical protein
MTRETPIEEIIPEGMSKADFVDEILQSMGNMHSHVDIVQEYGGYALIQTYEIDDDSLTEYGVPGEQVLWCTETLEEMRDAIIQKEGPRFLRSAQKSYESEVSVAPCLTATVSASGDTLHTCASKNGDTLTQEDYIQPQILEHQVMYHPESVTLDSPIILGGNQAAEPAGALETQARKQSEQHPTTPTKDERIDWIRYCADPDYRRQLRASGERQPDHGMTSNERKSFRHR